MNKIVNKEEFLPQIQESCLELVKTIDKICRKHHISYSLCGGSVIGAHLFQGFIPWDDDIDLMMVRNEYEKLLKVFPTEAPDKYRVLNYATVKDASVPTLFTRVEDLTTEIVEEIAGKVRKGHVFIDITVMDNVPSKYMHKKAFMYGSYAYTKLYSHNGMTPGTGWKKILFKFISGNTENERSLKIYEKFENYCRKYKDKKTIYCAELMSAAYSGYIYKRNLFDQYIDIQFEDAKLMVVKEYMEYLFMRYGKREFTKDVPPEQRFNLHIIGFKKTLE